MGLPPATALRAALTLRATKAWRRIDREDTRTAWLFILSALATFTAYRGLLWMRLGESPQPPLGFMVEKRWLHELFGAGIWDVLTAVMLGGAGLSALALRRSDGPPGGITCNLVHTHAEDYVRGVTVTELTEQIDAHRAGCRHCDTMLRSMEA